ncbi:helix-turn-helix domain-containing protein [Sulfitobacter sp. S190]|uniref:IclR family transcriptional regulator n=1 Tax=Sulfitobacter sp. S190 TaxID=2867022 RepID=UPI00288309FE|nr:helix-turn-helix domain-containing protein [Sulfitobacter sp. S190]
MMDGSAPQDEKDRNFVTALARGLEVLRCFKKGEIALTNSDFAERTGLPKPTVSRLTHTLCALDYLVADADRATYRLSAGVLQLGLSALASVDIHDRAVPEMRRLRTVGPNPYATVALGEVHRSDVIYLATEASDEDVSLVIRVGSRLPVFKSAIGKAILVGMDPDRRERVFELAGKKEPRNGSRRPRTLCSRCGGICGSKILLWLWDVAVRCERDCRACPNVGGREDLWVERRRTCTSDDTQRA